MHNIFRIFLVLIILGPAFGADFTVGNSQDPESLDPTMANSADEMRIASALFEGLVSLDPQTCHARPGVAESWRLSEDGRVYTFRLRTAFWSDGTPVTAQQVVDSWLRTLSPETNSSYAFLLGLIVQGADAYNMGKGTREKVGVRAIDDRTFEMRVISPTAYALDMLAHPAFAIVPTQVITLYGSLWANPANLVTNGPFTLKEWVPCNHLTVVRNPKYWDKVSLDAVTFLPVEDDDYLCQLFLEDTVDWDTHPPLSNLDWLKSQSAYQISPMLATSYYIFNLTKKPFDDVRVRKALALAIDRHKLVSQLTRGAEMASTTLVPPMPDYTPLIGPGASDAKARKLLADAGYPEGKGFPAIKVLYNTSERHKSITEWLQQQWHDVLGIDVVLQNIEWQQFLKMRNAHDFMLARAGWVGDFMDPTTFLEMFLAESGNNNGVYANPAYDNLMRLAAARTGQDRMQLLQEAEAILITRDQAILPLYHYVNQDLIDTAKWTGWYPNVMGYHPFKNIERSQP